VSPKKEKREKPEKPARDETPADVVPGEYVSIKDWVFEDGWKMTAIDLVKIGWPNKFKVCDVSEEKGKPFLSLDPCCDWMVKPGTDEIRCRRHPASMFFKLAGMDRTPAAEDRYASFDIPWGNVLGVEFLDDEKMPVINLRLAGGRKPFSLSGPLARDLRDRAKEFGLL